MIVVPFFFLFAYISVQSIIYGTVYNNPGIVIIYYLLYTHHLFFQENGTAYRKCNKLFKQHIKKRGTLQDADVDT